MPFFPQFSNLFVPPYTPPPVIIPSDISDLALWLDADDANTLYDATSGGSLVTTNGSDVKRWQDKSGNDRHATEDTQPPTLLTSGKNSKNVLNFNSNKWITSSFSQINFTAQTSFVVFRYDNTAGIYSRALTQSQNGVTDYLLSGNYLPVIRDSGNTFYGYVDSNFYSGVGASTGSWYIARSMHTGSELTFRLNNTTGTPYSNSLGIDIDIIRIGATYLANGSSDGGNLNAPVAEVVIYAKSLSDSESAGITNYLNAKWAIY